MADDSGAKEQLALRRCIDAFQGGDFDLLLRCSDDLEKMGGDPSTALMYRGVAYFYKKSFVEARKIFYGLYLKKLVRLKSQDDNLLFYLALCDLYLRKYQDAIDALTRLAEKEPGNVDYKIMIYLACTLNGESVKGNLALADALAIDAKATGTMIEEMLLKSLQNSDLDNATRVILMGMAKRLKGS